MAYYFGYWHPRGDTRPKYDFPNGLARAKRADWRKRRTNRLTLARIGLHSFLISATVAWTKPAGDQVRSARGERLPDSKNLSLMSGLRENPQITFEERSDGRPHPAAIITPVELSAMKYSWVAFIRARLCARAYIILLPSGRCIMRVRGT